MPPKTRRSTKSKSHTRTLKKRAKPSSVKKAGPVAKHDKLTSNALKFIDQAANLLREGILTGASESTRVRHTARKRAHALIEKAHTSLGEALDAGTSALQKVVGKM